MPRHVRRASRSKDIKPVFAVYSTFLQRAYDQVVHDIRRQKLNVIFAIDRAGLVGPDGETHQGVFDIAFLRHMPNMTVMMPKDENELRRMLRTALDYDGGPIAVRYPACEGMGVPMDETASHHSHRPVGNAARGARRHAVGVWPDGVPRVKSGTRVAKGRYSR